MTRRFAEDTKVPISKSQDEVKKALRTAGADEIAVFEAADRSMVAFRLGRFYYRLTVPTPTKVKNAEQDVRRAWRLLLLLIKGKLEAVREGVSTVEREFLADMMTEGGATVHERLMPELIAARDAGRMPKTLMIEGPR